MGRNPRWTSEVLDDAKRLRFEERRSVQEIANIYGVSRQRINQVIGKTSDCLVNKVARKRSLRNGRLSDGEIFEIQKRRFMMMIRVDPKTGCWIWRGTRNNYNYGKFYMYLNGEAYWVSARRAAQYFTTKKLIPMRSERYVYICGNRLCCNPDHIRK